MRHSVFGLIFLTISLSGCWTSSQNKTTPPIAADPLVAPVRPVTDTYFGIKVVDPYRYMENLSDPAVQAWFKAQADHTRAVLDRIPGRDAIFADIKKYVDAVPASVGDVSLLPGDKYFYMKILSGQNLGKLYMRQGLGGKEVLFVDTDQFKGPRGEPAAINSYAPSPDGRYVAYVISKGGAEIGVLRVRDVATGKDTGEEIDRVWDPGVSWLPDGKSFFFNRLQKMRPSTSPLELEQRSQVYLHTVGHDPDRDIAVLGIDSTPHLGILPIDWPFVATQPDSDEVLGFLEHGTQNETTIYAAPLASIGQPDMSWTKVCDVDADVTSATFRGDDLYLLTHKDASRYKIVRTSLHHPDVAHAKLVVPQGAGVLRGMTAASDALYVNELDGGISRIIRIPYGGRARPVKLPYEGNVGIQSSDTRLPGIVFSMTGWTRSANIFEFDPATMTSTSTGLQPPGPYDAPEYITSREVDVASYDGTLVPLSIICRKDIKLDGSNPTVLMAYGAYGITIEPFMSPSYLAWFDRGGVLAVAHVRGGGERGEDWHKAGYKLTKPNTWRDAIACAEYLVREKYTSPQRLGITGGSAGGIMVGRSITERPDLFAAAVAQVGAMNTLRAEFSPNGVPNIPEFGSVMTQAGFEDLFAMDSYQHVRDGVAYPAVMLTTGINDPRVAPWEPGKMAARLEAATAGPKPILLRVDYQNGHGIGASRTQREEESADSFAFFLSQFGLPDYRPAP
ncbi:MAG TPA: prolyl oligopeptidase family serine peptidase [Tepidisphaeraceae bacterium]|nr:prolyl oligopeptidase family serine peptidase [Tepidisphaeraceae bacterium]